VITRLTLLVTPAFLTLATAANAASVTVNSTDDIYAAGQSSLLTASVGCAGSGVNCAGTAPSSLAVAGGETVTFSVTGSISLNGGGNTNNADGVGAAPGSSSNSGYLSISGITAPDAGYLVGVFVPSSGPSGSAPTPLDFSSNTSFTSLSPSLDQVFFIGDGLTGNGTGTTQSFIVPSGAGELFLGISDACGYNGSPSCYDDNSGSFSVTADISSSVSTTPLPAALPMFAGGLGMVGLLVRRRKSKAGSLAAA
jgi:hypothetical protein